MHQYDGHGGRLEFFGVKRSYIPMNTKELLTEHRVWVREQLDKSVNFWLKHGMDPVNGGVYTCLDREGKIYSTDKSV